MKVYEYKACKGQFFDNIFIHEKEFLGKGAQGKVFKVKIDGL